MLFASYLCLTYVLWQVSFQRLGIPALTTMEYVLVALDGLEIMVEKRNNYLHLFGGTKRL